MKDIEIKVTAEQLDKIQTMLWSRNNRAKEVAESGNREMQYFLEGQADGIGYVLEMLGIEF